LLDGNVVDVRVGERVGRIACGGHTHQGVAEGIGTAPDGGAEAHGFEIRLLCGNGKAKFLFRLLFIDGEALAAGEGDGHGGKGIAVTGDAAAVVEDGLAALFDEGKNFADGGFGGAIIGVRAGAEAVGLGEVFGDGFGTGLHEKIHG